MLHWRDLNHDRLGLGRKDFTDWFLVYCCFSNCPRRKAGRVNNASVTFEVVSRAGVVRITESFDSSTHKDWERSEMSHHSRLGSR
jgi:hypothetical protein